MISNFLLLNSSQYEVIVVVVPQNLRNIVSNQMLTVYDITLDCSNTVRNLGIIFDQDMSFKCTC